MVAVSVPLLTVVLLVGVVAVAAPTGAVVSTAAPLAPDGAREEPADSRTDSQIFDDRKAEKEVDLIVNFLLSIAVFMAVMLGVFLWHTSPRRRLRVARTRADRRVGELRLLVRDDEGDRGI